MNFRSYIAHACAALLLLTTSAQAESSGPGNVPPSYGSPFSNPGHAGPSSQSEGGKDLATILREPLPSRNTERVKALKDRIAQLESAKAGLDREFQMNPNMGEQDLTRLVGDYQGFIYPSAGNETASLGDVINPGINLQTRIGNLKKYAGGTMRDLILQYRIELITLEKQRDMRERNVNCGGEVQDDPDGKKLLFVERRDGKTDYIKGRDDALFALFGTRESAKALRKKYLNDMSRFLGDVIKNCDASSKMVESIKAIFPIHARLFRDVREEDFNRNLAALIDSAMLILDFEDKELRKGWGDQLILRGEETLDRFAEDAPVELAPTLKKRLADIAKNPRLSVQKDARTTVALLSGSDKARQFRQFLNLGEKDVGSLSALTEAVGSNDPFRSNNPVTTGQHFTKPSDIAARLHYGHSPKALEALDYQPSGNREDARKQLLRMLEATKKPDFAGFFPTGNKPKGLQPLPDETRAAYRRVVEKALARVDGFKPEQPHATPYIVQLTEEQNLITAAKEACENDVEENLSSIADFVAKSTQQPLPPSARVQLLKFPRSYRVLLAALSKQMVRDLRTVEIDIKDRQPALRAAMKIEERQKFLNELIFSPSLPKLGALIHSLDWKAVFDLSSTSEAYADFNPYREKHESLTPGNKDQLREKIITRILAAMARGKEYVDSENPKKTDFACADSDVVDLGTLLMSVIDNWEGTKGFIPDYLDKWKGATIGNYSHDFVDFMQELNLYNLGKYKPNDPELTAERERARRRGLSMNSGDRVRFLTRHELTEDDKKALAALKSGPLGDRFKREDPTGYANLHAHPTRYGIQEASNLYGKYSPYNVPDYVSTYRKNQFRQSNHRFVESALKVLDNPVKFDDLIDRFGDYYLKRTGQQLHHALQASRDTLKKMHEALLAEEKAGVASEKRKRIVAALMGLDYNRLTDAQKAALPLWDFYEYVPKADKITLRRVLLEDKYDLPTEFASAKGRSLAQLYAKELENAPADVLALLPHLRASDLVMLQEIQGKSTKEAFTEFLTSLRAPEGLSVDSIRRAIKKMYLQVDPWYLEDQLQGRAKIYQGLNGYLKEKKVNIAPAMIENLNNYALVGFEQLKKRLPEEEFLKLMRLLEDGINKNPTPQWANLVAQTILAQQDVALTDEEIEFPSTFFNQIMASEISRFLLTDPALRQKLPPDRIRDYLTARAHEAARLRNLYEVQAANENNENKRDTLKDLASRFGQEANDLDNEVDIPHIQLANHYLNHTPYSGRGMVFAHSDNLENMDSDTFRSVVTDPHAMDLTQLKRLQAELGGAKDELPKKSEERKKGSLKFFETLSSNQAVNSTPTIMNCLSKASKEQRDFNVQEVNDCYKELYQKLYALMHFMGADSTTLKHAFVGLLPFDKQVFGGLSDITALLKPGTRLQIVDGKVVRNSLPDFIKNMSNEDLLDLSLLLYQYESGEMPAFLAQKKLEAQAEIDEIERSQDRRRYIHTLALQLGADFLRSPEKYTFPRGVDPKDARSLYAYATFQLSQLNNPNLAAEFKRRKQEMVDETFYRDYPLARMFMSDSQEMKDLRASLKKNSKLYNNGITFADRGWLPSRMLAAEILHRIGEGKLRYETNPGSSIGLMDGPFKQNFDWNRVLNPTLEDPPGKSLDHLLFRVFHQEGLPTGSRFNEPSAWWNWAEEKPAPIFVDGARFLRVYDTSGKTADQVIADLTAQGLENPELTLSLANIDVAAWRASGKRGQGRIALTPSFVPTYLQTTLLTRKLKDVAAKAETDPKVAELKAEREKERKKAEASAAKTAEFNAIVSTEIEQRQKQLASHLPTFPPKALKGAELDNWVARLSQDEKEALLHYANLQSRNKSFPERVPSWASWAVALEQKYPPRLLELKWGLDEAVPITTAKYYSDKIADHKVTLANATDSQLAALFRAHSLGELGGDPSRDTTEDLKKSIRFGHTGPNVRTSIDQVRATLLEEQRKLREKAKDPLAVVELYTDFNYGLPTGYDAYLWAVLQEDGELKEAMYELELRLKKKPFVKGNPKEMFEVPRDKMLELRKKYLQMFADIRDGKPVELAPWAPVLPGNGNREVLSIALTNVIRSIDSALLDTRQKDSTAFMATNLPKLHSGTVREYRTLIAQEVDGSHDPTRSDNVARVKAKARELAPVSAEATTATQTLNPLLVSSLEDFIELTNDGDRSVVTHDSQVLGPKVRKDQAGRTVSAEFKDILNWAKKRYAADILQNPYAERLIDIIMKNPDLRSKFFDRIRTSLPFADLAHFDQVKRMIEGLLGVEGVPPETNFKKVEALRAWLYEKLRAVVGDPDSENPKYPALGTPEYKQANAAALLLAMIDRRNQSGQDPRAAQIRRALGGNLAFTPEGNWPLARKEFEGLKKLDELAAGSDDKADFARRKRDQYHAVLSFLHNQGKGKLGLHSASRIKMLQDSSESNWDVLTHLTKAIPHLGGNNYARERLEDMLQFYDEKKLHALAELFDPNYLNHRRATQIHEQVRRQLIDALAKSPNGQLDEANQEKLDELVALRIAMEIVPQLLTTALASNSPNFQATVEAEKERLIAERKDAIREEVEKDIRRNAARQVLIAKFATEGLNPELLDESKLGSIAQPGSKLWEMSHDPQFLRTVAPLLKDPSLLKARNDAKINFEGIPAHDGQPAREGWVDIVRKNRPAQKQTVDFLEKHFFAPARAMVREEHPGFDRLSEDEQWKLVTAKAEDAFLSRHVFEQLYHEIKLKRHLRDNIKPFADAQQDILDLFDQTRDELRAEHGDNWRELPPATKRAKIAERARQLLAKLPDSPDTERNKARVAHFNALLSYMNENAVSGGKSPSIIYPDPDQFLDRVHAAANIGELGLHSPLDERRKRELERGEQEQEEQIRRINFLTSMADRRLRSLQLEQTIANQNLNGLFGILMGKLKGKIPTDQLSSKSDSDKAFVREFRAYFDASEASLKDEYLSPELTAEQWQKWDRLIAMATGSRSEHFFGAGEDIIEQIHYWSGVKRGIETAVKDAKKKQEEAQAGGKSLWATIRKQPEADSYRTT
ncbi:MAG: hypothetical protein H6617_00230 [Bdellovibrionaceae bacterium]|nr:hypothetical protein [Pseudobdellovibrionaceae bacterium]